MSTAENVLNEVLEEFGVSVDSSGHSQNGPAIEPRPIVMP